jgi:hypothetical protein
MISFFTSAWFWDLCFWFWRLNFHSGESGFCFYVIQQKLRFISSHCYFQNASPVIMKVKVKKRWWCGEKKKSCPYWYSNFNPLAVQPVASHYTDCTIPAPSLWKYVRKSFCKFLDSHFSHRFLSYLNTVFSRNITKELTVFKNANMYVSFVYNAWHIPTNSFQSFTILKHFLMYDHRYINDNFSLS